ncbi:MAG: hypothetical protein H6978_04500 [Gammaproteobacteria bacterium]|nr:hypothetical protein [Gammaproteobacteria bacterium]
MRRVLTGALLAFSLAAHSTSGLAADAQTVAIMHQVYDAISYLLPVSIRDLNQDKPYDTALVNEKLTVLENAADGLVKHASAQEAEFAFLARSFDRTIVDLRSAFDQQWPAHAYFAMMDLTQYCAACHSRLPSDSQARFGQILMARIDTDSIERVDLARLYLATRQFDAAMDAYERVLNDPQTDLVEADIDGTLSDYLHTAISVAGEMDRAAAFINKLAARDNLPQYLVSRFSRWRQDFELIKPELAAPADIDAARTLFSRATSATLLPYGRDRAVLDFGAANRLRVLLTEQRDSLPATVRAEAYYLLGIITLRSVKARAPVPDMELLMEAAIRTQPHGSYARPAYAVLEEYGFFQGHLLQDIGEPDSSAPPIIDMAALRDLVH